MRTLSVQQPWATLLIAGKKRFDARGWHTTHRGLLAIHACSRFPPSVRALCAREPYRSVLRQLVIEDVAQLPRGVVLGTVCLLGCSRVEERPDLPDEERLLGDFRPGCWVWEFIDPRRLPVPVPLTGQLGVFEASIPG
jgi:hypothetical protein